jgi:2'-5' RNA ligase
MHYDTEISQYALVAYVPDPLGSYLDGLRAELAPSMNPGRSHVTLLQPRPLAGDPAGVWSRLQRSTRDFSSFEIDATGVDTFDESGVVYLSIGSGSRELEQMHLRLNVDGAAHVEPYPFQPHITIAQGLGGRRLEEAASRAKQYWADYDGPRSFRVRRFHFVRYTVRGLWLDLDHVDLAGQAG